MAKKVPTTQQVDDKDLLLNDQPTLRDRLKNGELIKEIRLAIEKSQLPQVFGIHGDWGAGKTTLLHQLQYCLTGKCPQQSSHNIKELEEQNNLPMAENRNQQKYIVVWFEAWRYQNEQVPIVALLHEMREQLSWYQQGLAKTKKLLNVAAKSFLVSIEDMTKCIGIQASKIQETGENWEKENLASKLPTDSIRQLLQHAIDGLLGNKESTKPEKRKRLVILIDDIDRCESEAAYKLLEGLKIYLTLENTVFVLGMNQRIVEDAIARNLKVNVLKEDEKPIALKERSSSYMEKICQNIWRMPMITNPVEVMLEFFGKTLDADDYVPILEKAFERKKKSNIDQYLRCLPPNTRRLKGFANLLTRFKSHIRPIRKKLREKSGYVLTPEDIVETRLMIITAYIFQFHHDVYRRWLLEPTLYEKIREWCLKEWSDDEESSKARFGELFPHIQRYGWGDVDETNPTPQRQFITNFPDPAVSTVFWIQPLIIELGDSYPVDPSRFHRFLYNK